MFVYVIRRIFIGIVSLLVLVTIAFFLTRIMPGSPFQSANVSKEVLQSIEEEYGLDKPVAQQYITYIGKLLRGDLGVSFKKPGVRVSDVIGRAWPITLRLGVLAILTSIAVGGVLGLWQAVSKSRFVKGGIFLTTVLGMGIPNFVVALLLLLGFGVKLKLLPVAGLTGPENYILPAASLAVYPAVVIAKLVHNGVEEELRKDYVIMAKAKGLKFGRTLFTHILKNACLPVLNYTGPVSAFLLTGSFVVESIFTIPGLGREFVNSIGNRDYTLILGLTVFMGVLVMGINLLTDLLCAWLDPKVRRSF